MALRHRVHSALWRLGCRPTASHRDRGHRSTAQDYERAIAAAKTQEKWLERVRNFSIVAHIDHGKSTLADRLLEFTGFERKNVAQVLDSLEVERERGITIKAQTATLLYFPKDQDGKEQEIPYILNLIDTPGHVDFSFEVNRSVYACDGGLLLVDSSQGIEAQTIANYRFAKDAGLKMVPVLTKLDLPHAHPEQIKEQLLLVFDIDPDEVLETSAKRNTGIESVLEAIVKRMPHPFARAENLNSVELSGKRLKAQILDSWYDIHRGAICLVKIVEGTLSKGQHIHCFGSGRSYEVQEVGILTPVPVNISCIPAGQVGYMIAGMKTSKEVLLGDTFYDGPQEYSASNILPGFQKTHSMVFASIFPCAKESFGALKEAVEKLTLNDASVEVHLEDSDALGSGFTCGFNGVLHMEVFCERLTSEHAMDVIITSPTVPYRVHWKKECRPEGIPDGQDYTTIKSPSEFPDLFKVKKIEEPFVRASILCPEEHIGPIQVICQEHRGIFEGMNFLSETQVLMEFLIPFNEVVTKFYNRVKSSTSGHATINFEAAGFVESDLVKIDLKINDNLVNQLSVICLRKQAPELGKKLAERLRQSIDRQQFEILIQASIGSKVVAKERIPPYRRDVLTTRGGKAVGGGDKTRKQKLLAQQKESKKRMKAVGQVEVPQEAFLAVLKL